MALGFNKDPIGSDAGDVNLYRIEGNSPTDRLDPSGLKSIGGWLQERAGASVLWSQGYLTTAAIKDAASGYVFKEAMKAAQFWEDTTQRGLWRPIGNIGDPERVGNAARHLTWMALLTIRHGQIQAALIAILHELGADSLDSIMDRYNNYTGITIGIKILKKLRDDPAYSEAYDIRWGEYKGVTRTYSYVANADEEPLKSEIESLVETEVRLAIFDGKAITKWDDPRLKKHPLFRPDLPRIDK